MLVLDKAAETLRLHRIAERPALSLNRDFSAPIKLTADLTADDLRLLAAHDSDPFNRWQAVQTLASALLVGNVARLRAGEDPEADEGCSMRSRPSSPIARWNRHSSRRRSNPPSEADIAREIGSDVDPDAIFRARTALARADRAASQCRTERHLPAHRRTPGLQPRRGQRRTARCARTSASICSPRRRSGHAIALAATQYQAADNMTDRMAALSNAGAT